MFYAFRWVFRCVIAAAMMMMLVPCTAASASTQTVSTRNPLWPENYVVTAVPQAQRIPLQFYQAIGYHQYKQAENMTTARTKPNYDDMGSMRFFANLRSIRLTNLHDVTKKSGVLRQSTDKFYAVKVYVGTVTGVSRDAQQQASLNRFKYHRFVVVKTAANAPWRLDDDEGLQASLVKDLWSF